MVNFIANTPSPNIGNCSQTSNWDNNDMISDCKKCISRSPEYGRSFFYCDGSCFNQYELDGACNYNSLVAKNINQCDKPCVQSGEPPVCGECSDNFDCPQNQECKLTTITKDNMQQKNCGVCTPGDNISTNTNNNYKNNDNKNPIPNTTNYVNDSFFNRKNISISIFVIILIIFIILLFRYYKNRRV